MHFFKTILLSISLILFPISDFYTDDKVLQQMISFSEKNNLSVKNIQLTFKKSLPIDKLNDIIKSIEQLNFEKVTNQDKKIVFKRGKDAYFNTFSIYFKIFISEDESTFTTIAMITLEDWDQKKLKQIDFLKKNLKHLFSQNVQKFVCLTAETSVIIDEGVLLSKIKNEFKLDINEIQNEKISDNMNKTIVYGNTPLWKNEIHIAKEPMNMQVALTNHKSEGMKITIGTPILINEY